MRIPAAAVFALLILSAPAVGQRLEVPEAGPGRLRAERVRYDARTQTFHAEGNVILSLGDIIVEAPRLRVDQRRRTVEAEGGVVVRRAGTVLRGHALLYEIVPRLAHVSGEVRLEQDGTVVTAGRMTLNIGTQTVEARDGMRLTRDGTTVTGEEMVAHLAARRAEVTGHAVLVRPAGPASTPDRTARVLAAQETKITAERLRFQWDANEAEAEGTVVVTQPERTARAGRAVYSEARGVLELVESVEIEQRSGEWLVEGGVVGPPRDADSAKALSAPVRLRSDRLVVHLSTRDMQADGRVRVEQEGRLATGDRAIYTRRDQTIILTGSVRLREADGSWLRADRVIIAIADETFEATGNVETEFSVTRGK